MYRVLAAALLLAAPLAGCTDEAVDPTYVVSFVEGTLNREPFYQTCSWAARHAFDAGNQTVYYRDDVDLTPSNVSRLAVLEVRWDDGGCPRAWGLHPNPSGVPVANATLHLAGNGTVRVVNETRDVVVHAGESWRASYNLTRQVREPGGNETTQYVNGTVTVHALGSWPRSGLVETDDVSSKPRSAPGSG